MYRWTHIWMDPRSSNPGCSRVNCTIFLILQLFSEENNNGNYYLTANTYQATCQALGQGL